MLIGRHDRGIRCVEWLASRGLVATLSWDSTLRAWDPRIRQARSHPGSYDVVSFALGCRWLRVRFCIRMGMPEQVSIWRPDGVQVMVLHMQGTAATMF